MFVALPCSEGLAVDDVLDRPSETGMSQGVSAETKPTMSSLEMQRGL